MAYRVKSHLIRSSPFYDPCVPLQFYVHLFFSWAVPNSAFPEICDNVSRNRIFAHTPFIWEHLSLCVLWAPLTHLEDPVQIPHVWTSLPLSLGWTEWPGCIPRWQQVPHWLTLLYSLGLSSKRNHVLGIILSLSLYKVVVPNESPINLLELYALIGPQIPLWAKTHWGLLICRVQLLCCYDILYLWPFAHAPFAWSDLVTLLPKITICP